MIEGSTDVIEFINEFYNRCGENTKEDEISIRNQFMNGYCYYFAKILQSAFERGTVCWVKCNSHIVWLDTDNKSYDSDGLYNDYNRGADIDELLAEDKIKPYIKSFKHVDHGDQKYTKEDHEWSEEYFKENNIK